MIVNTGAGGSGGIKMQKHDVFVLASSPRVISIPESWFVFLTSGDGEGTIALRGQFIENAQLLEATLSSDGTQLTITKGTNGTIEYWAFG